MTRLLLTILSAVMLFGPVVAQQPAAPKIILPVFPVAPVPIPAPDSVIRLDANTLYVVRSNAPLILLTSPPGLLMVTADEGPIRIKARFADGDGSYQTRLFTEKFIYSVEAVGTGLSELIIIPSGVTAEKDIVRRTIDSNVGPRPPPPDPKPDPKPDPPKPDPTPPAPIPVAGLRVLIVYETADLSRMPAAQSTILYAKSIRDYLNARCVVGPDGKTREFRIWDKDVDATNESETWRTAFKRPRTAVPWIVISDGKAGFEGPLPATVADTMALLKKFGG